MKRSDSAIALLCFLLLVTAVHATMPTEYGEGFVEHRVCLPRLDAGQAGTDLARHPWDRAALLTGNLDWRRVRTADVPIRTFMFYDAQALWLAYRCEDKPGKDLKAEVRGRDQDMKRDDHFTFELDAGLTGRVFYRFVVNSAGAISDSVIIDKSWNSHATVQTAVDEKGWSAVLRLPFSDFTAREPSAGEEWSFNIATRSGIDNSWAPVLGGYHIPEQFARLVFTGRNAQPVRMLEFKPLHLGVNGFRIQAPRETRCLVEAADARGRMLDRQDVTPGEDGRVRFVLHDERIHHVNFAFRDSDGRTLLSFWRPAEIPQVIGRLPSLREKAEAVRSMLEVFPQGLRAEIRGHCEALDALLKAPIESPLDRAWLELSRELSVLERRLTDAWLYARTLSELSPKARFALAVASPMDKVMIKDFPCPGVAARQHALSLARNEHEAMQVIVVPMISALKSVKVDVSHPVGTHRQGDLLGKITASLVGHVKTVFAGSYLPDYVGWYPDPILDFQQVCDVERGDHVAFWVNVTAHSDARPGAYESTVTVSAQDCEPIRVRLNIHVWDIALPQQTHLRNAFTYSESNTKRLYRGRWTAQLARRYHDFILDHRLNIDSLYGKDLRDVELLRYGISRGMNAYNLFYVGRGASADVVMKLLQERIPPLRKAGIDKQAYLYGFDEVNDEVFPRIKEVFGRVHALYPDLPRMTTGYDNTFGRTTGLRPFIDIWVPLIPEYNMLEAQRLRAEGKDMWWYLCVGPRHPYPNWFVDSPTIEARLLMGAMSYKYRVGGVLYFMMNNWSLNDEPVSSGPYTNWFPGSGKTRDGGYANGDGSIFCPGPEGPLSTMRFENIRDGIEDYEYLHMLAEIVDAVSQKPPSLRRGEFLQDARALLAVPSHVVESSSRYTDDPRQVAEFRDRVAQTIIRGRQE